MTIRACDLGGTRLKIGVVRDGIVLAQTVEPANSKQGLAPQLPVLKAAWLRLLGELKLTWRDCAGIGVAFPSLIDADTGRVLAQYGKFADAMGLDLRAWAKDELGLPLAIENDARMALIGEWRAGAGRGVDDLVMMTIGTGLGVGVLIQGRLLRGKHGQAGVLGGHTTVRYGGRECNCGNVGCAEAEASTAFLCELAACLPEWDHSSLRRLATLNYALAVNLIHAYDPEMVILGGGIMASAEVILPAVRAHVARHAHTPWGKVRVVAGELGDRAALLAGEWLVQEQFPNTR